jgi:hypothetical protein
VDRFERENINIIEFGSSLPLDKKISIINQKFIEYAKEQQSSIDLGRIGSQDAGGTTAGSQQHGKQQPGNGAGTAAE